MQFVRTPHAAEPPTNTTFETFWEAHGSGYMGPVATTWVPMGAQVPVLSPTHPEGNQQVSEKVEL